MSFAIRLEGGRFDGLSVMASEEPPDDVFVGDGGVVGEPLVVASYVELERIMETVFGAKLVGGHHYRLKSKSQLPEDLDHPNLVRGGVWEVVE